VWRKVILGGVYRKYLGADFNGLSHPLEKNFDLVEEKEEPAASQPSLSQGGRRRATDWLLI
jgi:hypothetical protein